MLNLKLKDRVKVTEIRTRFKNSRNFLHEIRKTKWNWTEHMARMSEGRWTYSISNWLGSRTKGKQKKRCEEEIINFMNNRNYKRVTWDRLEWEG